MVDIDFHNSYPYKFAISSWGTDSEGKFQYKILTNHLPSTSSSYFVVILQRSNGDKTILMNDIIKTSVVDGYLRVFCKGLVDKNPGIDFEIQDASHIDKSEDFSNWAADHGWTENDV